MKLSSQFLALTVASSTWLGVACVGEIPAGKKGEPNSPSNPGGGGAGGGNADPTVPNPNPPPVAPPPVAVGTCNEGTLAKPRAWRLTHDQVRNTLRDTLGFVAPAMQAVSAEERLDGYANRSDKLAIAPLLADFYYRASEEVAANVAGRAGEFLTCPVAQLATGTCFADFARKFGLKMWRRPLEASEITDLTDLYKTAAMQGGTPEAGFKTVVQAFFLSPKFLYRTEIGNSQQAGAVTRLTDFELASALSYTLWDTGPDAGLLDLAAQGRLRDQTVLLNEAKRLLGTTDKASNAFHHFMQQWLYIESLLDKKKDATMFPIYSDQVAADLKEENRRFMNSVLFDPAGDKSLKSLFTATYGFVNARTAALYGVTGVTGNDLVKTELPKAERRGLLTQGSFLAAHADPNGTHLVDRGRYMREEIMCDRIPPPDPAFAQEDPKLITEDMTGRERFTAHSSNPLCIGCHALFDGLGFAMENYDAIGRFRLTDKNKMIDPTGSVPLPSGKKIEFKNYIDLIDQLAESTDLYSCFSSQYLTYAAGRALDDVPSCEKKLVFEEFAKSGYKMDALIMAVLKSPSFMARKN